MTLYERVGGEPAVCVAVEIFYLRVMADSTLAPFFRGIDMARLKTHQFAFLSEVLGGPRRYSGAGMARAHARLHIEQQHFDAVAMHLADTFRELGIGEDTIHAVEAAMTPLAGHIVNPVEAATRVA